MKYYVLYNPLAGNKTCAQKIEKLKAQYTENTEYCDMTKISDYRSFLEKLEEDEDVQNVFHNMKEEEE